MRNEKIRGSVKVGSSGRIIQGSGLVAVVWVGRQKGHKLNDKRIYSFEIQ